MYVAWQVYWIRIDVPVLPSKSPRRKIQRRVLPTRSEAATTHVIVVLRAVTQYYNPSPYVIRRMCYDVKSGIITCPTLP